MECRREQVGGTATTAAEASVGESERAGWWDGDDSRRGKHRREQVGWTATTAAEASIEKSSGLDGDDSRRGKHRKEQRVGRRRQPQRQASKRAAGWTATTAAEASIEKSSELDGDDSRRGKRWRVGESSGLDGDDSRRGKHRKEQWVGRRRQPQRQASKRAVGWTATTAAEASIEKSSGLDGDRHRMNPTSRKPQRENPLCGFANRVPICDSQPAERVWAHY